MSDFDSRFSGCLIFFECTVRPAHNATARDRFLPITGRFRFIQEVQILGTPDPWDCKSFPARTGFRYVQVQFKTGFTLSSFRRNFSISPGNFSTNIG